MTGDSGAGDESEANDKGESGTKSRLLNPTWLIAGIAGLALPFLGAVSIVIYTVGFNSAFGVAALAALAAAATGLLFGLLFGVPRAVSSGEARQNSKVEQQAQLDTMLKTLSASDLQKLQVLSKESPDSTPSQYAPSTNLAEVSDWLTKLLLGAGLVSLTRLGAPVGHLIDSVASGMSPGTTVTGPDKVVAGAILFGYSAMGFLDGYVLTTLWYQKLIKNT